LEYRVDELSAAAGVSVELLRSYQSRGLLPPPRHEGRVAIYGDRHLERLRLIRDLKDRGYSLRMVAAALEREPRGGPRRVPNIDVDEPEETFTLRQVAERTGVHPAMLRSLEASGVLRPRRVSGEEQYTGADVRAVRMLLSLLSSGVPMEDFMRVARVQLDSAEEIARGAVELFMKYVREPLLGAGLPQREEAERLVAALRLMIHSTTSLMSYHFQRMVVNAAQEEIERRGSRAERVTLAREARRRRLESAG
jgi:DNA-binding transcriptional MerR regulator